MTFVSTPVATLPQATVSTQARIASIDIMRGLVMVIMALDHTRDYFHTGGVAIDPTDLSTTSPLLFFTRIITHYCAPTFVFLSGMSAYISRQNKSDKTLSLFLLTRGIWLIILEFTVVRLGITFNLYYDFTIFQVIWVIGASMIVLSALVFLNPKVILIGGLIIIFGHNLFDLVPVEPESNAYFVWSLLRQSGVVNWGEGNVIVLSYPLIPWLGIMMTGYGMGVIYSKNYSPVKRQNVLLYSGITAIALFILIRFINVYGDPAPWTAQKDNMFTVMSFLKVTKYPPSLLYVLMTLGPVLVMMSWMDTLRTGSWEPFRVIGRVPLFYYILHFYFIHLFALLTFMIASGTPVGDINFHFSNGLGGIPTGFGFGLGWVYVAWISIVLFLYPLCKWYHQFKSTHRNWWLSYL